jgi:uncharacterized membrane protein
MFDNARYNAALWAHIVAILVVLAGVLFTVIELGQARRAKRSYGMAAHARRGALAAWATVAICVVALVPAVYMVPKKWSWQQGWVRTGFAGGALMALLLLVVVGPALWRLAATARSASDGDAPLPLRRRATAPLLWGAAQIVTTVYTGNVIIMFAKPRSGRAYAVFIIAIALGLLSTLPALRRYRALGCGEH